jgi:hypothetical protein
MAATTPNPKTFWRYRVESLRPIERYTNFHMLTTRIGTPSALTRRRFLEELGLVAGTSLVMSTRANRGGTIEGGHSWLAPCVA